MTPSDLTEEQWAIIYAEVSYGTPWGIIASAYGIKPKSLAQSYYRRTGLSTRPSTKGPPAERRRAAYSPVVITKTQEPHVRRMQAARVPDDQVRRVLCLPPQWPVRDPFGMDPRFKVGK